MIYNATRYFSLKQRKNDNITIPIKTAGGMNKADCFLDNSAAQPTVQTARQPTVQTARQPTVQTARQPTVGIFSNIGLVDARAAGVL